MKGCGFGVVLVRAISKGKAKEGKEKNKKKKQRFRGGRWHDSGKPEKQRRKNEERKS